MRNDFVHVFISNRPYGIIRGARAHTLPVNVSTDAFILDILEQVEFTVVLPLKADGVVVVGTDCAKRHSITVCSVVVDLVS
jgi:hypothetical protein